MRLGSAVRAVTFHIAGISWLSALTTERADQALDSSRPTRAELEVDPYEHPAEGQELPHREP